MPPHEVVSFVVGQVGKAEFDVAAYDRAPLAAQHERYATQSTANGEGQPVRQQANHAQQPETDPDGPGCGRKVEIQWFATGGHAAAA